MSLTGSTTTSSVQSMEVRASLRGLDLHDLELDLASAGRDHLDGLALLAPDDRLPDRRLVRELALGGVRLRRADDEVLDRLLRGDVPQAYDRADRDDARVDPLRVDHACIAEALLELGDPVLEHHLLVLRVVVLRVLGDLPELAGSGDALRDLAPLLRPEPVQLAL